MEKVRSHLKDTPTYITFDIDGIDPSDCPGTGDTHVVVLLWLVVSACLCLFSV